MIKCSYSLSKGGMYIYLSKSLNYQNVTELSLQKKNFFNFGVKKANSIWLATRHTHHETLCFFYQFFSVLMRFSKKKKWIYKY